MESIISLFRFLVWKTQVNRQNVWTRISGQEYLTHRFVPCEFLHDFVIIMQRPVDVKLVSETVSKRQSMSALMVDY